MRVNLRIALVVIATFVLIPAAFADHLTAECALSLVGNNQPASSFALSPHGVYRSGSQVFVLRGQTLTTYTTSDIGDLSVVREDFIGSLAARETQGGTAFSNGFLYVSGEAGLEIFDLRNVRAGGNAPLLVSRTSGLHYRRMVVNGNQLAGLYPATDIPCAPQVTTCTNYIDIVNISNANSPTRVGMLSTFASSFLGFNDVAFNNGFLIATGGGGTYVFNTAVPSSIAGVYSFPLPGTFLVSNGTNLLGVGNEGSIEVFTVNSGGVLTPFGIYDLPALTVERLNPIMFHPQAFFDEPNGRLVTLIDEKDVQTLTPARTIAFDVFDFTVPFSFGSDPKPNESVSYVTPDEVKFNPVVVGANVFVVGTLSGLQTYGSCGNTTGRFDLDGSPALVCGGTELHGWVSGTQKVVNVEVFLDSGSLGSATVGGIRPDIDARSAAVNFRIGVNLDATARGEHTLRAVSTDALGNRRQFASQRIFFAGPGQNCTARRRVGGR